jgi:hypothetical protein
MPTSGGKFIALESELLISNINKYEKTGTIKRNKKIMPRDFLKFSFK